MTPMSDKSRKILTEIDETGIGLTKSEINFVAALVDGEKTDLSKSDRLRLYKIHQRRVANATEEDGE